MNSKDVGKVVQQGQNLPGLGTILHPDGHARVTGSCGDTLEMFLRVAGGRITEASFMADGCLFTLAAGSTAVSLARGLTPSEAAAVGSRDLLEQLGDLPADHEHCAKLAADTLHAAVLDYRRTASEPWKRMYRV
jgi:nitrogen fixation protein NifU and related proteins